MKAPSFAMLLSASLVLSSGLFVGCPPSPPRPSEQRDSGTPDAGNAAATPCDDADLPGDWCCYGDVISQPICAGDGWRCEDGYYFVHDEDLADPCFNCFATAPSSSAVCCDGDRNIVGSVRCEDQQCTAGTVENCLVDAGFRDDLDPDAGTVADAANQTIP